MEVFRICLYLILISASFSTSNGAVTLNLISSVYLPYDYDNGDAMFGIDVGAVEQGVMDTNTMYYYGAGNNYLHVIDFSDAPNPRIIHAELLPTIANDIEICSHGGTTTVGVALEAKTPDQKGTVALYEPYSGNGLQEIAIIDVGYKPDMLKFSSDCSTILVANEGEAYADNNYMVNPEGSITIIDATDAAYLATELYFTSFESERDSYVAKGVRWPYRGEISSIESTFSQNMEPEYIAFNYDNSKAYIALQENNAVAEIDLVTKTIVDLNSLGTKSWSSLIMDASDRDGKNDGTSISLESWDIYSLRQPDAIKYFKWNGGEYLITANEGEGLEYEAGNNEWTEAERGEYFYENDLYSTLVSDDMINNLDKESKLGRLKLSTNEGMNAVNKKTYDNFYMFGSRGFSIFDVTDYSLVYDSGDEVERMHAIYYPDVFNGNTKPDDSSNETPADLMDTRSDNQGPECESLEIGELNGKTLLFVGVDRSASILIYSFHDGSIIPTFESLYREGDTDDTFDNLLQQQRLGNLDPEDLRYIAPEDNTEGKSLLLVTSTVSGSVALYEIVEETSLIDDIPSSENLKENRSVNK